MSPIPLHNGPYGYASRQGLGIRAEHMHATAKMGGYVNFKCGSLKLPHPTCPMTVIIIQLIMHNDY